MYGVLGSRVCMVVYMCMHLFFSVAFLNTVFLTLSILVL